MTENTARIKTFFLENKINVFGIAQASSLETEPAGYRPSDLITAARSIVCVGIPFPKGIFQCAGKAEQMYWRAAAIYYRHLDFILTRAAAVLEETGDTAVPVYG